MQGGRCKKRVFKSVGDVFDWFREEEEGALVDFGQTQMFVHFLEVYIVEHAEVRPHTSWKVFVYKPLDLLNSHVCTEIPKNKKTSRSYDYLMSNKQSSIQL